MNDVPARSAAERIRDAAQKVRKAFPGVLAAAIIAMAATFISDRYGGPAMLFALLLGMAFPFLSQEGRCADGIQVAAKNVLRFGVALLGARITFDQIASLGFVPVVAVVIGVSLTTVIGALVGRAMGLGRHLSLLTAGAVAICGASAALAIASVLPKDEKAERNTIFTVIAVTTLGTAAMIFYPLITGLFGFGPVEAGFFLGATIHDVAQVVGAGYSLSEETGDFATFTKLLRVAMLLPMVMAVSFLFREEGEGGAKGGVPFQGFLFGFAGLVVVNSFGLIPEPLRLAMVDFSGWCLLTAIAALGMKTSLQSLAEVGPRPIALVVGHTLFITFFMLAVILIFAP